MEKLSVVIITLNEEQNVTRCLQSVQWADEVLVLDTGSTDRTVEICQSLGARVVKSEWLGFGKTKRLAVEQARYDWILSIDADEEVTPALQKRIQNLLHAPDPTIAYRIKRQSFYLGQPIRHAGWQKDFPLRLFNRKHGNFNEKAVHESVVFNGQVAFLSEPLNHYTYPTISAHIQKMDRYTSLSVGEQSKAVSIVGALLRGLFKFFKMYVLQAGFLDGRVGLVLCLNSAFGIYLKYIKRWEAKRK